MEAIAFYLPQYHAIPENDQWWGQGFTEWNNVRPSLPLFPGHYQPHVPHKSIGYYDLSDPATIERQHRLALRYGVSSFCYYYYNFSGKTLLDKPLRLINKSSTIRNKFCLCWANHDWTRVWYGQSKEVLLSQEYTPDNAVTIFRDIATYMANPRYIRIQEKPLLLVFNPEINPLMQDYSAIWREQAKANGFAGLHLMAVESLALGTDPAEYGFDSAVEFAPDWSCATICSDEEARPRVYDFQATASRMIQKPKPPYTRLRCIFPGWDNTPRYQNRGLVFVGNTLGAFKYFAQFAKEYTHTQLPGHLQYVFINAWNEWGEGCHLEPDELRGYAPLEIIAQEFKSFS